MSEESTRDPDEGPGADEDEATADCDAATADPDEAEANPDAAAADPDTAAAAHAKLAEDPDLGPLVAEHGPLELEPAEDPFRRLVVSVIRQQVSMDAAAAIRERLFDTVDATPEGVLAADEATLREAGLSAAKTRYVRELAATWQSEGYSRASFDGLDDDAVRAELTGVTGIGDWTADMFLMFGLGRPDVFPVGDLGIRKGMRAVLGGEPTRAEMVEHAERWRPYRSYASLYVWRATD